MTTQNSSSGKEPQGSLISNPHVTDSCQLLGQVLDQAAQFGLKHLQGQDIHGLSGHPVPPCFVKALLLRFSVFS